MHSYEFATHGLGRKWFPPTAFNLLERQVVREDPRLGFPYRKPGRLLLRAVLTPADGPAQEALPKRVGYFSASIVAWVNQVVTGPGKMPKRMTAAVASASAKSVCQ